MAYSTATLAAGCFGKVYKEKYNDTWAAIKKVPQHLISKKDLERECKVYNQASHPNIVRLLGNITLQDSKWVIPMEFIFGEDLETTIFKASKSKIQLTSSIRGTIIIGMCEGLLHLHNRDIVHQDLKPDNIMVEHGTNRAVIIDLGLAKFFRNGLNSAVDMGNEAYSAPEVLMRGSQRDQRSDVWAMGKIIAELCARVRLPTLSVGPAKIKETLKDQPYSYVVCRMVENNPTLRASMGGVINDIRRAGGGGVTGGAPPRGRVHAPFRHIGIQKRSPSPLNGSPSPPNRTASPRNRTPSPQNGPPPPRKWERAHSPKAAVAYRTPVKNQALVPAGQAGLNQDFMKMMLHQEASKDLPCALPTTGVVRVRRYQEKDGEVEVWEQKEVVMKGGRIVKYDDIMFNNKR